MNRKSITQSIYNIYFNIRALRPNTDSGGPVFIVGTGRSGTHFLCSCLNAFPELDDGFSGKESKYMFNYISNLTVEGSDLPISVLGYYYHMISKVKPRKLVDQTHPNIWHVERLMEWFPDAKFLALTRDVYSVVYSMTNHRGVAGWEINHAAYPKPNKFLGITEDNQFIYRDSLTDIQRFVFRWCSHSDRNRYLSDKYPDRVLHIKYENLAESIQDEMDRISSFLGVRCPASLPKFNNVSLRKKDKLSDAQRCEIKSTVELYKSEGFQNG